MRIIHVVFEDEAYGIGTFVRDLLDCQVHRRPYIQPAIAFHRSGHVSEEISKLRIHIHNAGVKRAVNPITFFKFIPIIKPYDIVQMHTYSPWAFLSATVLRKPIIYNFHGALGLGRKTKNFFVRYYHRLAINRCSDWVVFASKASKDRYQKWVGRLPTSERMASFPFGLNPTALKPKGEREAIRAEMGWAGKFVVGTAARMDPMKSLHRLVETAVCIQSPTPILFVLMGSGDRTYESWIRQLVIDHDQGDKISFLGFRPDARRLMEGLDLFVLPSREEPFGLALLEALGKGIPSAVFVDGGGLVDIIGDAGCIVSEPADLAGFITGLSRNTTAWKSWSKKSMVRAEMFDIRYTADNLERLYRDVLKKR